MKINVIRGQGQIGGSIIEVSTANTSIVLDVGINFDEGEKVEIPSIDGLFYGVKKYDAIFVSHYHSDHIGLLDYILDGIPVYMGERAYRIVKAASEYRNKEIKFSPNYLYDKVSVLIGDIKITPILCDHSAFDSYMFLLEADGKSLLYTGDFRANGRLDYGTVLKHLPHVDALIIEGTTLSREENRDNIEEEFLENIAFRYLKRHTGPAFIMMSAMNVDRIITASNIAQKTNRVFLEDIYTALVAASAGKEIPQPNGINPARVFMTGGDKQYKTLCSFGRAKIGKNQIAKSDFVMCVRPSMRNYLEKLNELCSFEDGVLFYGMWKGYLERPDMKSFVEFMEAKGVKLHILHTSGHADNSTIEKLIDTAKPHYLIPIHTENAEWFNRYSDEISIVNSCNDLYV